ncbi:MAG: hypothetical protein IIT63_02700 [Prevotella sp.]|nr:hypothetical protein [Prevotella sp.]
MRTSEYDKLFVIRNLDTGKLILTYWASSQKHKAIFSTRQKAEDAISNIEGNVAIEEIS